MLTARNVKGGYWKSQIDGQDGAGVVHGKDAISFAKAMSTTSANWPAIINGANFSSFTANDFNPSSVQRIFNIKIPSSLPVGKHLRIVLTWDSSPDLVANVNDLSDLDLSFNNGAYNSLSVDGNVEIIDVPNGSVVPNGTYTCAIVPYTWRIHPNARSTGIYSALVWGWVTDHAR